MSLARGGGSRYGPKVGVPPARSIQEMLEDQARWKKKARSAPSMEEEVNPEGENIETRNMVFTTLGQGPLTFGSQEQVAEGTGSHDESRGRCRKAVRD